MRINASRAAGVQGLKGSEVVLGVSPLEMATTLATGCLDNLQFAVKRVHLGRDVEDAGVRLVVASDLGCQTPVIRAAGQVHGLVVRGCLARDGVDEPHG